MNVARLRRSLLLAALLAGRALPALSASDLGSVDFPTSGAPAAQAHFLRGVAALHSFWYDEAADAFREAQKADPGFAMAFWGEAMTCNHPVWSEQDGDAARAALARLAPTPEARAAKAPTAREKAWLAAVEALYDGETPEKAARDRAYAEAMRRLHERFPEDLEGASFYALSLIGPALTSGGSSPDRERDLMQAAALLEELFDRNPRHPGVLHYLIHAYDDPVHAPLGLRAARLYAQVAPAAHHALHMPSHIFVQLGQWTETAASNEAAWAASVDWVKRRGLPVEKRDFHSLSWLAYAYLQQGRVAKAAEVLEIARQAARESDAPRVASALKGMEARHFVETGARPKPPAPSAPAAAADAAHAGGGHCAGAMAYTPGDAGLLLAEGLGAARSGDLAAAEHAAAELHALSADDKDAERAAAGKIMEQEVRAVVLEARGKTQEALALLREATELEERMPPPSGPPSLLKPAHELYGEVLLAVGKADEAARQFERSLLRAPNRAASLLGAARAAVKLGDAEAARRCYAILAGIWEQADPGLPDLAEVLAYLKAAPAR
jgi:tetratricopeptide (TPR) repeat protein